MAYKTGEYRPWQKEISAKITKAILGQVSNPHQEAPTVCVRISRQGGKNEVAATVQYWFLHAFGPINGDHTYVRSSLNWRPQIVNSKIRLEKLYRSDVILQNQVHRREGYIYQFRNARIIFLSSDTNANVVGETASVMLDMDEAHKVDENKFQEDFQPFTASTNAPTVLWGVAADSEDILYKHIRQNEQNGMSEWNIQIRAEQIAELDPKYAKHYERRVRDLGKEHIIIKTQYDLLDVDQLGTAFSSAQLDGLFKSDHQRMRGPKGEWSNPIVVGIDLAGEEESGEILDPLAQSSGKRDSTFVVIGRVMLSEPRREWVPPRIQILDAHWWTGKRYKTKHGEMGQEEAILAILNLWKPDETVCDGRGIGHPIAMTIRDNCMFGRVEVYQGSRTSNSQDASRLYRYLNHRQLNWWQDDGSPVYREAKKQFGWCNRKITGHDVQEGLAFEKPRSTQHIDAVMATNYLVRAAWTATKGKLGFIDERW